VFNNFAAYFNDSSGYHYYWDKKAKAPFRYNPQKHLFATFDDKHSIREKTNYLRRKNLGGIMFWELINDLPVNGLVDEIHKALRK